MFSSGRFSDNESMRPTMMTLQSVGYDLLQDMAAAARKVAIKYLIALFIPVSF